MLRYGWGVKGKWRVKGDAKQESVSSREELHRIRKLGRGDKGDLPSEDVEVIGWGCNVGDL